MLELGICGSFSVCIRTCLSRGRHIPGLSTIHIVHRIYACSCLPRFDSPVPVIPFSSSSFNDLITARSLYTDKVPTLYAVCVFPGYNIICRVGESWQVRRAMTNPEISGWWPFGFLFHVKRPQFYGPAPSVEDIMIWYIRRYILASGFLILCVFVEWGLWGRKFLEQIATATVRV